MNEIAKINTAEKQLVELETPYFPSIEIVSAISIAQKKARNTGVIEHSMYSGLKVGSPAMQGPLRNRIMISYKLP